MKNQMKAKILKGDLPGTFFETGNATVAECLGLYEAGNLSL